MRIVALSDSHNYHDRLEVPDGDVLVHAGDFCGRGRLNEVMDFREWLRQQPHAHKVVIAGNHDVCFEKNAPAARALLEHVCTYLQDRAVTIDGVKFYGSPWQPFFCNWAFNLRRGEELARKWELIPEDVDVLITHGPPYGILDRVPRDAENVGCRELSKRIVTVKPKVHIFGHIHEGYGHEKHGGVDYYNVAVCTGRYDPINPITVIDI